MVLIERSVGPSALLSAFQTFNNFTCISHFFQMSKIPVRSLKQTAEVKPSGDFTIRAITDILKGNDILHELHRHTYFFILAVKTGSGSHDIDFERYPVNDRAIFLLRPGQVHQLELKSGTEGYLIEFDTVFYHPIGDLANQRLRKATNKNFCEFEAAKFARLFSVLDYMFHEYSEKENGYWDVIKSNLDIFFIEYNRHSQSPNTISKSESTYTQERFEELSELIEKNIATLKQVSQYADLMHLSAYQLNSITKDSVNKSASEVITQYILLEAKRYLLATSNQVKEIADTLGYEDISYFIRFFKKHTGYSPESYRQNFK